MPVYVECTLPVSSIAAWRVDMEAPSVFVQQQVPSRPCRRLAFPEQHLLLPPPGRGRRELMPRCPCRRRPLRPAACVVLLHLLPPWFRWGQHYLVVLRRHQRVEDEERAAAIVPGTVVQVVGSSRARRRARRPPRDGIAHVQHLPMALREEDEAIAVIRDFVPAQL